ncbi:PR domain zinc finger protein 15 [Folsomia candida]|uniref:PR domain zinc finger protein 15 n=1 Tax=Folsomia candida TaxID=158441 RepID=A0A226EYI2_FOLCA|nr:PR domain zinc finger protein 15 [Folsomia candida]
MTPCLTKPRRTIAEDWNENEKDRVAATTTPSSRLRPSSARVKHIKIERDEVTDDDAEEGSGDDDKALLRNPIVKLQESECEDNNDAEYTPDDDRSQSDELIQVPKRTQRKRRRTSTKSRSASSIDNRTNPRRKRSVSAKNLKLEAIRKRIKRKEEETLAYDGPDLDSIPGETWADYRRRKDRERVRKKRAMQKSMHNLDKGNNDSSQAHPPTGAVDPSTSRPPVPVYYTPREKVVRSIRHEVDRLISTETEKKWDPSSKKWKKNRPQNLDDVAPEAGEDLLFKEMLILKLQLEFENVRSVLIAEAVELELGNCVPSLERPAPIDQSQSSNDPAQDDGSDHDHNEDDCNSSSDHDGSACSSLEVVMVKPEPSDIQDKNEMQDWIANTVSAADDDFTNSHNSSGFQPKNRIHNIRKQERASQLELQLELCRARWMEEKPDDSQSRDLIDIERQSLIDQVILEKKELIKHAEVWLSQKRELYSKESLTERSARIAARLKDNEPQHSTPKATGIPLTPEEKKSRHAQFSRIRCRMEKKEYEIHLKLVATLNPAEFANTLTHPDHQPVIQYWTLAAGSNKVKVREELIKYRKMLGKFLTLTKTSKISYNKSSLAVQVVESSVTTNFKEFHTFLEKFGSVVLKYLEHRRFYVVRRIKKYNELSLEEKFKDNLYRKEWKAKKRGGGVISEEARAKFDAEREAGVAGWEARKREKAMKKQLQQVMKCVKGSKRQRSKKTPSASMSTTAPPRKKMTPNKKKTANLLHTLTTMPTYLPPQRQNRYHVDDDHDDWTPNNAADSYSPPPQDDDHYVKEAEFPHQQQHHTHQHFMAVETPVGYELGQVQLDGWVALSTPQQHDAYHHEQINSSYQSTLTGYQQHLSTINTNDWSSNAAHRNSTDDYTHHGSSQPKNIKRKPGRPRGSSYKSHSTKLVKDSLKRCRRTHPPNTDFWGNRARKESKARRATLGPAPPVEPLLPETICPLERSVQKMLETKLPENVANLCPKCPHCDKVFNEESAFKAHLKKRHSEQEVDKKKSKKMKPSNQSKEKFTCPICDFVYTDRSRLYEHLYAYHWVKNEIKWMCPFSARVGKQVDLKCNNLLFGKIGLLNHFKRKHPESTKHWYLPFDSRSTTSRSSLFVCLECDHDCKSFSTLIDHYVSTHDHLRWGCEHCGVLLRRREQLDDHVALFHPHDHRGIENSKCDAPLNISSVNVHKCATCLSEFSSVEWLQSHVNKGHRFVAEGEGTENSQPEECDTNLTCFWCRKVFKTNSELMDHIDKCHPNEPPVSKAMEPEMYHCAEPYKCELCAKSFLTLARLRKHCFEDHDLAKYVELIKEKVSIPKSTSNHTHQDEQHAATKYPTPTIPPYSASLCQLCHFTTSHSFHQVHLVYDQVMKRYCQICQKLFGRKHMLILHMNAVHSIPLDALVIPSATGIVDDTTLHDPNDPPISCPECPKVFTASQFHHYHSFHAQGIWSCPHCPSIFITREMRLKHVKDEHNPGKKVITPEILESLIHATEVEHSGKSVTIYTCKVCMKNYKNKEFVITHILEAHKNNAFTRVMCPQCNATFQYAHSLRGHMITAHSEERMKRFKCPACPKTITNMPQMKRHVQKFHAEVNFDPAKIETVNIVEEGARNGKRFLCNICTQDFSTEDGLKSHITGKHFPIHFTSFCDHCGLQISEKSKKWHMRKHHSVLTTTSVETAKTNKVKSQVSSVFELLEILQKILVKTSPTPRNQKRSNAGRKEPEESDDEGQESEDEDDNEQSFSGTSGDEDNNRKSRRRSAHSFINLKSYRLVKQKTFKAKRSLPKPPQKRSSRPRSATKSSVYYIDDSTSFDDDGNDASEFSYADESSDDKRMSLKKLFINPSKSLRRGVIKSSSNLAGGSSLTRSLDLLGGRFIRIMLERCDIAN